MKKILIHIVLGLFLFYLLIVYLNQTFIPVRLKAWLVKKLAEQSHQEVDIEELRFSIAKGFVLTGVKIYEGPKANNKFLFRSSRVSFGIILLPSIKKHSLIIPRLSLHQPFLNLERSSDGSWNISSLFKKEAKEKRAAAFGLVIKSLYFDKGELSFADYYQERNFQRVATALKGKAGLSLPGSISLSCTAKIDQTPLRIISTFKPLKKNLLIELETKNLPLADYCMAYLHNSSFGQVLNIDSGIADVLLKIDMLNFEEVKLKGDIYIQDLKAGFKDITASGNYKLSGKVDFNLKDSSQPTYDLKLELDRTKLTTPFKPLKDVEQIEGVLSLSQKRWHTKELSCLLYGAPALITGEFSSPHKDFIIQAKVSSTIALEKIADVVGIGIESGLASVKTEITYKKDRSYQVSGKSQIEGLRLRQKEILISGDFSISGESSGIAGDLQSLEYKGDMSFTKAKLEGVGLLPFISDASGEATFSTKHITIKRLAGLCADTEIALSGSIDYEQKEPGLAMVLKADNLSLSKLISTLPEKIKAGLKDIDAKGICSLNISLSGTAGQPETFEYEGGLLLKEGYLTIPYWPNNLSNIDCDISFDKNEINWKDLTFDVENTRYHSYGKFSNPAAPNISFSLISKDINLMAEIKAEDKIIDILKCKGKYLSSDFSITGRVSDIKTAYADLSGNINFNLKDTPSIFKAHKDFLGKLKPEGIIPLNFNMQGPLKEVADWTLYLEGGADNIFIWGLRLDDFYIDYRMKDRFIDLPTIAAHPYGGIINISSRVNLKKASDKPYIINIDIKDVDLHQLVMNTELKNKKIKGSFAAKAILNGYLDQKDSLKGSGWLQVSDGYLWEFPVMRGMMEVIFMVPPEYITLTDAFGNFVVHSNRLHTEDFKILSKTASLLWVGSLGLDGTLDFNITGRFAEDILKKTTEPGRIASAILREAGSLIMEIRLTGTLAKPRYQIVPFPIKRIFQEKVVDKFKDIFGDVFE